MFQSALTPALSLRERAKTSAALAGSRGDERALVAALLASALVLAESVQHVGQTE